MNKRDREVIEDIAEICVYGSGIVLLIAVGVIIYLLGGGEMTEAELIRSGAAAFILIVAGFLLHRSDEHER